MQLYCTNFKRRNPRKITKAPILDYFVSSLPCIIKLKRHPNLTFTRIHLMQPKSAAAARAHTGKAGTKVYGIQGLDIMQRVQLERGRLLRQAMSARACALI
ncbi:hypothetical protein EVAR_78444_1 [Eumeta japonica]|uniref:Uncharacterized protein n=1 Tax=Eumeta variegata TaxID=151549 RepID=A0A4C1TZE2_EUMVA|nr:hypothetical protein EVAR_78444_1 [Eumeta japonica]